MPTASLKPRPCRRRTAHKDPLSRFERSERMRRIRSVNTKPERLAGRMLREMGYLYRAHVKCLPGKPDMVFSQRKKAIFIHGCFWHRHKGCRHSRMPRTRLSYWRPKLFANRKRDIVNHMQLRRRGWGVLVIWECELKRAGKVRGRLVRFLGGAKRR